MWISMVDCQAWSTAKVLDSMSKNLSYSPESPAICCVFLGGWLGGRWGVQMNAQQKKTKPQPEGHVWKPYQLRFISTIPSWICEKKPSVSWDYMATECGGCRIRFFWVVSLLQKEGGIYKWCLKLLTSTYHKLSLRSIGFCQVFPSPIIPGASQLNSLILSRLGPGLALNLPKKFLKTNRWGENLSA